MRSAWTGLGRRGGMAGVVAGGLLAVVAGSAVAQGESQPADAQPQQAQQADLPAAETIFDRYLEVTGGLEAHRKQTTRLYSGTIEVTPGDYFALLTLAMKAPSSMMMRIENPGSATQTTYFDGQYAWVDDGQESEGLIIGDRLREVAHSAQFFTIADYQNFYPARQTLGIVEIENRPAYRVGVRSRVGKEEIHFFDVETGLLVATDQRIRVAPQRQGGEPQWVLSRSFFRDYKEVDGVKMFTRIDQVQGETISTIRLGRIEVNAEQFPEITMPPAVRSTIERIQEAQAEAQRQGEGSAGGGDSSGGAAGGAGGG